MLPTSSEAFPPRIVGVLILPGVVPFDLVIAGQIFGDQQPVQGAVRYRALFCTPVPGLVLMAGGIPIGVPYALDALQQASTVIVPGLADVDAPIPECALQALRSAADRGVRLMSICTGAFVLAAARLLDDRAATTHWAHTSALASRYPRIRVDPRVLFVDDGNILTSAGMAAGIDLCLHVVRQDHGALVANTIARNLVVAPHRSGGQAQFIESAAFSPSDSGLARTCTWVREQLHQPITVLQMASHACTSIRHFNRRFKSEMGVAPLHWLLEQRVQAARQLLETTDLPISQIATQVGMGSPESLRAHFTRIAGTSPREYRRVFRGVVLQSPRL